MKIWFAWKWWAGKTTLSSLVIKKLSEKFEILAMDLDSNVNLANSLNMNNTNELTSFWTKKEEVMNYTWSTSMTDWENRIYLPKETDWFYDYNHKFVNEFSIKKDNIKVMSLWFIDDERRWMESMCDYYEMSKVFVNHLNLSDNQLMIADLAAGVEMVSRATVMSFDLVFVITDANFKNIKVTKQILRWLDLTKFTKEEIVIIPNKFLDEEDLESIKNIFSDYNIINWLEYSQELYELDSNNELINNKIEKIDKIIDNITKFIIDYKINNKKNTEHINNRIKSLDKIKFDFIK